MSLLDGGVGGAIAGVVGQIIDRAWPDPTKKAEAQLAMAKLLQDGAFNDAEQQIRLSLAQAKINEIEAASPDFFRAGWRPAVGWVCAAGLAYQFLVRPLLVGFLVRQFPELDMGTLTTLLFGMLGLGAMRTQEKIKGVA